MMEHLEKNNLPQPTKTSNKDNPDNQLLLLIKRLAMSFAGITLIFLVFSGLLLLYSANLVDQTRIEQSSASVKSDLRAISKEMAINVLDIAWWDATIQSVVLEKDEKWLESNFQEYLWENHHIDEILILNEQGNLIYADQQGVRVAADRLPDFDLSELQPMLIQSQMTSMEIPVPEVGFIERNGELFWIAICAITPEFKLLEEGTPRATIINIRSLKGVLPDIIKTNGLNELSASIQRVITENQDSAIVIPLLNFNQQPVGYLRWYIQLPGQQLLKQAVTWSSPLLIFCLLMGWYISRWFRMSINNVHAITVKAALMKDSKQYFQTMADSAPVLIWEANSDSMVTYTNSRFQQLLGKKATLDNPLDALKLVCVDEQQNFAAFFQSIIDTGETQDHEFKVKDIKGNDCWLAVVCAPQRHSYSENQSYIFSASDISDRKKMEDKIWLQAHYDDLTGLPNRNLFHNRLHKGLESAARHGEKYGLIFIDLDNFKNVNDSFGHRVGDQVLKQAAERIISCLRESDTAARLGGDEFVILAAGDDGNPIFDRIAQRVLGRLSESFSLGHKKVYLSASIGLAIYPLDGSDGDTLMMNADTAMYRAKQRGRNQISYYTPEMNAKLKAILQMEVDLHQASEQDEFFLLYQPIIDLASQQIVGAEALIRWRRADGRIIPPDEFIPVAEQTGLIKVLGEQVLRDACQKLKEWRLKGYELSMSVNVSPVQFRGTKGKLLSMIKDLLSAFLIPPGSLQLELTETLLIEESTDIIETLEEFSAMGVKLAVDDFGTGYSALSYLRKFSVDILKIDRSFICDIPSSKEDMALVKAIIAMAHSLNLIVIAEGVETEEQHQFLLEQGCNRAQGYLYGRPMPDDEFIDLLKNSNQSNSQSEGSLPISIRIASKRQD